MKWRRFGGDQGMGQRLLQSAVACSSGVEGIRAHGGLYDNVQNSSKQGAARRTWLGSSKPSVLNMR